MSEKNIPLLRMENIVKQFPGVLAVNKVSFEINAGEIHALVGENGAGKSTLVKILTGVYKRTSGKMFINGEEVEFTSVADAKRHGIAYIPQEITLAPTLSVARNIIMGEEPTSFGIVNEKALKQKAGELLGKLGMGDMDLDTPVKRLGVGERQLIMICKALLLKPKVLILDEPTAPLTRVEIAKLFSVVETLRESGVGIVYISHRMEEIFEISQRVSIMRNGELVKSLPTKDTNPEEIVSYMLGKQLNDMYPKENVEIGDVLLEVSDLHDSKSIRGVSLKVHKGEILGIFGLVGAGKGELSMLLAGSTPKLRGEIVLNNESLNFKSPHEAVNKGLVLIPKDRRDEGLLLNMTITDNATLPSLGKWTKCGFMSGKAQKEITKSLMKDLHIKAYDENQLVRELSGGNQQKVVLAKWLATKDACLFIFDEPTRGVDVGAKTEIYNIISDLVKSGAGVILMSSELPEVMAVSDRILVLSRGRIVSEFKAKEATAEMLLAEAMKGVASNECEKPYS